MAMVYVHKPDVFEKENRRVLVGGIILRILGMTLNIEPKLGKLKA